MSSEDQPHLLRFDPFEIDLRTRELRQQDKLIKLQDMPVRLLILLATRAGELVTREEIEREIWGDDHFVDFDHGINTAMRKIREALGEDPESPRFIETLPRKGYRFISTVEQSTTQPPSIAIASGGGVEAANDDVSAVLDPPDNVIEQHASHETGAAQGQSSTEDHATQEPSEEFALPRGPARQLFLMTQAGYLLMYCVTLFKLDDAGRILDGFFGFAPSSSVPILIAVAVCGIAVRLFLLTSVGLKHPSAGLKYRKLFPLVFILDMIWAASPLLLVEKIGMGLAMASIAGLAYLPFSQRILMSSIYTSR